MTMRDNKFASRVMKAAASVLFAAAFITLLFQASPIHAAGAGRISGQLLDGTRKNAPLAGQRVTLQMAQGNQAIDLASATTNAHGSYTFPDLSTSKTNSYVLYISYQGAQYTSNPITLDSRPVQQVNLTVYEATTSTANMAIVRATILLRNPDVQKSIIPVSELIIFRNLADHTYVGSLDASHGKPNALSFSLPHTARNVTLGKGFDGYQALQVNGGFAANAAVPPGDSQFVFTFDMPYTSSSYDFDYRVLYPTVQLAVLVPAQIQASSDTLAVQGAVTANGYRLLQASALLANKEVNVQLDGLPVNIPAAASAATSNPMPTWLLVILLIMAAVLFGTWFLYRSVHRQTSRKKRSRPGRSKREPARMDKTADSEQALLQELLELDKALETDKIAKAVYQERRAKTKARLRALMKEKVTS